MWLSRFCGVDRSGLGRAPPLVDVVVEVTDAARSDLDKTWFLDLEDDMRAGGGPVADGEDSEAMLRTAWLSMTESSTPDAIECGCGAVCILCIAARDCA